LNDLRLSYLWTYTSNLSAGKALRYLTTTSITYYGTLVFYSVSLVTNYCFISIHRGSLSPPKSKKLHGLSPTRENMSLLPKAQRAILIDYSSVDPNIPQGLARLYSGIPYSYAFWYDLKVLTG